MTQIRGSPQIDPLQLSIRSNKEKVKMNKEDDPKVIKLKNLKVAFANLDDKENLGKSILVVVDDPVVEEKIKTWVSVNRIGKDNPGETKFNEYEGQKRFKFKLTKHTEVVDMAGQDAIDGLNYGAVVSIVAKAYEYHHKHFGSGVSQSLQTVVVMKPAINEEKATTANFIDELHEDASRTESEVAPKDIPDGDINLDEIPF